MDKKKHLPDILRTSDACANMIVNIRQLRLSVLDLFTTLADTGPDPHQYPQMNLNDLQQNGNSKLNHQSVMTKLVTSHELCTSSVPPPKVQMKQEQQQQQDLIKYVSASISTLAKLIQSLDQDMFRLLEKQTHITTGESVHLGLDGSLDKHKLYMDLCQSYKTIEKLREYSSNCHTFLLQQSLKRANRRLEVSSGGNQSRDHQRQDSFVATFNPYMYKMCPVVSTLETCMRTHELMDGVYSQPFGLSTGVFQVSVNRVLKAVLVMRGVVIDAVIVKAYHESFATKATKGSTTALLAESASVNPFVDPNDDIDLWSESKYAVFRRLTHHANAAVLHFQYPSYPEVALRSFMSWFSSYSDLFAATCSRCNTRLRKFMPPICREFSTGFLPYHDSCK